jgi:hypothetical protein
VTAVGGIAVRSVSFTAARIMSEAARGSVVTAVLAAAVPDADRYVTGACVGGDAFIGRWLHANRPGAGHMVVVPADRSRVDYWWLDAHGPAVTVIEMPPGTSYAYRNARLVAEADAVFGFPAYPEDDPRSARSGTWQTARMARAAGNLSQWRCVTPPYRGMVERPTSALGFAG